jgi:hypothetical protein
MIKQDQKIAAFGSSHTGAPGKKAASSELFRVLMYLSQRVRAIKKMASTRHDGSAKRRPG